jgi:lysine 2,3-aminomutase
MAESPGGGGKIPLLPDFVKRVGRKSMAVENFQGKRFTYPLD